MTAHCASRTSLTFLVPGAARDPPIARDGGARERGVGGTSPGAVDDGGGWRARGRRRKVLAKQDEVPEDKWLSGEAHNK